jgi:hypothetical protein
MGRHQMGERPGRHLYSSHERCNAQLDPRLGTRRVIEEVLRLRPGNRVIDVAPATAVAFLRPTDGQDLEHQIRGQISR